MAALDDLVYGSTPDPSRVIEIPIVDAKRLVLLLDGLSEALERRCVGVDATRILSRDHSEDLEQVFDGLQSVVESALSDLRRRIEDEPPDIGQLARLGRPGGPPQPGSNSETRERSDSD